MFNSTITNIPDYRRWLWAEIAAGNLAVTLPGARLTRQPDAPIDESDLGFEACRARVVRTAVRKLRRDLGQRKLMRYGADARTNKGEVQS